MIEISPTDRIALQDVLLNYALGLDERNKAIYSACFAPQVEIINFGSQIYHGRDAWVEYVWNALEKYTATQHLLGPLLVTRIEDTIVHTRTAVQATHFLVKDGSRFTLYATYHTQFQRLAGQWLISQHELQVCGTSGD